MIRAGCIAAVSTLFAAAPASASFYGKKTAAPIVAGSGDQGPVGPMDIDVIENLGAKVPLDLSFTDGQGRKVALADLLGRGKPLVVTLGYYRCPMLCNLVHEGLVKAVKKTDLVLGRDFLGLAISIDPNEDPKSANTQRARLLRALEQGQDKGEGQDKDQGKGNAELWPFVIDKSPDAAAAKQLVDAVGFRYKYDPQSKQFAHSAVAFVLSPEGIISRYIYGIDFVPRDLRFAVVEAGGGRVGTSLDRVLLSCFRYDPFAKRYTPFAGAFVRIGAGLSGLALVALLGLLWRKELQMRRRSIAPTGIADGIGRPVV